ncbi:MAG: addiction module protein [Deltaproteobacteria bacterium]|nr:addiction module protein [Deltaproteobacteria bacterium]MDQ3297680.1 addiction module protein [Myxococcota bacterium]
MSNQARQVLEDALRLPINERADVAAELLRSLDEAESALSPEEVARRWTEEITKRAERAIRGESVGRDADEVLSSIESKLRRR